MGVVINGCTHSGCRNINLTVSHKEISGINLGFGCFYINSGRLKVTLIIGHLSFRGSYKITVVCGSFNLPVHPSVSSAFSAGIAH